MHYLHAFISSFIYFWKNCFRFTGRATRAQFWWNQLWYYFIVFAYGYGLEYIKNTEILYMFGSFMAVFLALTILPRWTLAIRRYRDIGFSNGVITLYVVVISIINTIANFSSGDTAQYLANVENVIVVIMLIVALLPTDQLTTTSHSWFFRTK